MINVIAKGVCHYGKFEHACSTATHPSPGGVGSSVGRARAIAHVGRSPPVL
jgi:hypothetical protein